MRSDQPRSEQRHFAPDTSSIGATRRFVREVIEPYVDDDVRLGDIDLATSELVTNAIEYGDAQPVLVAVDAGPQAVVVAVTSAVGATGLDGLAERHGPQPVPAMRTGRGLAIVRAVSDLVELHANDDTVTVTCTFRVPNPQVWQHADR